MPLQYGLKKSLDTRECFLSIGNFDGVHRGHQSILSRLVELANRAGLQSVVLTFEPHPIKLLRPEFAPPRLTTLEDKAKRISQAGVDQVIAYPTDRELLNLTAEEFFEQIIIDHFRARGVVEGPNFFFGKDRTGTIDVLGELCRKHDLSLDIVSPYEIEGAMASSSSIRKAIEAGEMATAKHQLGRDYSIHGIVAEGDQRGRTIGFPTANLEGVTTLIPGDGVYAARTIVDGRTCHAAVSIGPNPTFGVTTKKIEAHLLNFSGDLYGKQLRIEFVQRVRTIQSFANAEELKSQINFDLTQVEQILDDQ